MNKWDSIQPEIYEYEFGKQMRLSYNKIQSRLYASAYRRADLLSMLEAQLINILFSITDSNTELGSY
jgi:hypothetical protein